MNYYYLLHKLTATQPKITVETVVNITADLKEIPQDRADRISAIAKRKNYTTTEALISVNQNLYLQTTHKRLYIVDSVSAEMYERLHSINNIHSRTANYSNEDVLDEIRNTVNPFINQLYHPNRINGLSDGGSSWLARLLTQDSTIAYTPLDVPVTGVLVTVRYLLNCNNLLHKCAGYCM